jgi:hypothetical protein
LKFGGSVQTYKGSTLFKMAGPQNAKKGAEGPQPL